MQRYRTAFFVTLGITILLAGAVVLLWLDPRGVRARILADAAKGPSAGASSPQSAETPPAGQNPSGSNPAEPNLVPVTLTPQRMQSIGVKIGTVEYRQVHDEIRTTGNVEAAKAVGQRVGERAKSAGITNVVFDRGGFRYHGRVAAVADGAREAGLGL